MVIETTVGTFKRSIAKPILSFPIIIWPKIYLRLFIQSSSVTSLEYQIKINISKTKKNTIKHFKYYYPNETASVDTLPTTTRLHVNYATGTR
jgi:hypothetical protein